MMMHLSTPQDVIKSFIFVIIAGILLGGQSSGLVTDLYTASLNMMSGAAGVALKVGHYADGSSELLNGNMTFQEGMPALTCTVETGLTKVLQMASLISTQGTITGPMPWLYAIVLIVPYILVIVVYFSLVVISIFRIMMIAVLSPFLILGFGFGWGREMLPRGMRALIGTFMVLFGGTAAISVLLYAVGSLDLGDASQESIRGLADINNPKFLMTLLLGWMATAFMAEATGVSNSITDGSFTNTSAAILTAGVTASAGALMSNPATKAAGGLMGQSAMEGGGMVASGAMKAGGYATGYAANRVQALIDKMKK